MRKILYSPEYGAGWTSWNDALGRDAIKFMLEYPPFIAFLEEGGKFEAKNNRFEDLPIVKTFLADFKATFSELYQKEDPYICLIGLDDLEVFTMQDTDQFQISEYDGSESVILRTSEDFWY